MIPAFRPSTHPLDTLVKFFQVFLLISLQTVLKKDPGPCRFPLAAAMRPRAWEWTQLSGYPRRLRESGPERRKRSTEDEVRNQSSAGGAGGFRGRALPGAGQHERDGAQRDQGDRDGG